MPVRKEEAFSLVELLVCIAIIAVIAALAVPSLTRAKMAANESSATASVKVIATAEGVYWSTFGSGFSPDLTSLGGPTPCFPPTPQAACILSSQLSTWPMAKSGYTFNAMGTTQVPNGMYYGFEVNATPVTFGVTGLNAYCNDQTGVARYVTPGYSPIGVSQGTCQNVATVMGMSGPVGE